MSESNAELAVRIYELVLEQTESFEEQNIGAALAYLMGAILRDKNVDIVPPLTTDPHMGPLWCLLHTHLTSDDPVFRFFTIEDGHYAPKLRHRRGG